MPPKSGFMASLIARTNQDNLSLAIVACVASLLITSGLIAAGPVQVLHGILAILQSRDTLLTDYFGIAGVGASLVHAGLLSLLACVLYRQLRAPMGGAALACHFLVLGFGLFGKNLLNTWVIVAGVWLYARVVGEPFVKRINTAFFAAALAPVVTEILFSTLVPFTVRLPLAISIGLLIGFIVPPVAAQLAKAHLGYALYNIGFTAGVIGVLVVAMLSSYHVVPTPVFVWTSGANPLGGVLVAVIFTALALLGLAIDRNAHRHLWRMWKSSGQAPSDFIAQYGLAATLLNMGLTGWLSLLYIHAIGGDINGPVIAGLLSVAGFGAYGKHPLNCTPVVLGVFLGSLSKPWALTDPAVQLTALFSTNLAPLAGRFGWGWGALAGYVHSSAALLVVPFHGGLNLYNNGFAAGLVASVLVPVILALEAAKHRRRSI
jgi:hypothetical protein